MARRRALRHTKGSSGACAHAWHTLGPSPCRGSVVQGNGLLGLRLRARALPLSLVTPSERARRLFSEHALRRCYEAGVGLVGPFLLRARRRGGRRTRVTSPGEREREREGCSGSLLRRSLGVDAHSTRRSARMARVARVARAPWRSARPRRSSSCSATARFATPWSAQRRAPERALGSACAALHICRVARRCRLRVHVSGRVMGRQAGRWAGGRRGMQQVAGGAGALREFA